MSDLSPFKINTSENFRNFCISLICGRLKSPIINTSVNFDFKPSRINTSKKRVGVGGPVATGDERFMRVPTWSGRACFCRQSGITIPGNANLPIGGFVFVGRPLVTRHSPLSLPRLAGEGAIC